MRGVVRSTRSDDSPAGPRFDGMMMFLGDELDDFMLKRNDISDFMMRRGDVSDFMLKRNDISDFMMKKRADDISDFMMKRFFPTPMVAAGL